jgi:hypothetical protein
MLQHSIIGELLSKAEQACTIGDRHSPDTLVNHNQ